MEQPLVSVIIPTYNRPVQLGELLESLTRQTYKKLEIIIANDAGEPVDEVVALYPELRVKVIHLPENRKHVHARNAALAQAAGEYILLCDDDDLLLPIHIERMLAAIADYDLVYSDVEIFDYELVDGIRRPLSRRVFAYEHDPAEMRKFSTFVPSGCLYRRSLHDTLGPFDEAMNHYWDWDFYLRAVEKFRVARVPSAGVLYAFSQQGGNISGAQGDSHRRHLDLLSQKHGLGSLPTKNFFVLLEEPDVKKREAATEVLWDGQPIPSRGAQPRP
ncbi:glycosyltransferase family 2 protein [Paenibacillus sambharensis]|uniref:Glycosyltransferase family 2 protein n=1 Tax=Paenibacillus sambharensis TaxID=1803190 RepID=A0A2W1L4Y6_9BACL|nr:glycosyltransferase family 2 protein [Paenibacillus sambharensis]PZD94406.1 glycosyltransferase family 2 protein [Paenibacillus sambharensis]